MVRSVPSTWYGCRSTRSLRIWKNNKKEAVKKERGFLPVEIPHDWQIYDASFFYEDCSGWYRKKVICKKEKNLRYLLRFEGIYMDSELYVNSRKVLEWKYGYSTFEADITDFLENGNNEIMVGVHVKHPNSRWYAGAGIYRNVWLKTVHTEHLVSDGIYVSTEEQKDGYQVLVYVETSQAAGTEVQCNLEGIEKKLPIRRDGDRAEFSFFLKNPKLWEPETPNLYMITVRLYKKGKLLEEEHVNFGCRTIETDPQQGFLLNHKKRKLKGVCLHHNLGALGSAVKKDAIKRQLTLMKEMGADAIRTAHNMPAVELMELADEMGFLIVSEAFDCWERPKNPYDYARFFTDWWKRDIASWVRRDRNHPSLIFWSIGNEIYDMHADERGQTFTRLLMEEVYRHDFKRNGRVTFGSNFMPWEKAQKCADIVKIAGYNYSEKYYEEHHREHPDWVIYGSETASTVQSRGVYHFPLKQSVLADVDEQCSALGNSTTSWGAKSAEACIIAEREHPYSMGQFLWSGIDYIGEPTPYHTKNSYLGQVDTAGFPKDSYYIYQAEWVSFQRKPVLHLFPYWDFNKDQTIDVRICSNASDVELFVNGVSKGRKQIDHLQGRKLTADYQVPYEEGEIAAVAYDETGKEVLRECRHSFGDSAEIIVRCVKADGTEYQYYKVKPVVEENRRNKSLYFATAKYMEIWTNRKELLFLEIGMTDQEGNPVENANNRIKVKVTGEGRLIGLDNGDSTDYDSYKGSSRKLFSGKLLAMIETSGREGIVQIELSEISQSEGVLQKENNAVSVEEERMSREENSPWVRKIELICEEEKNFSEEHRQAIVGVKVLPKEAANRKIMCEITTNAGIPSDLAEMTEIPSNELSENERNDGIVKKICIRARGDGEFRLRACASNGQQQVKVISSYDFVAEGLGKMYFDPYKLVAGGLYNDSVGDVGNGNEHGVSTARDGKTIVGFRGIDFGKIGSDSITLPIFELGGVETPIGIWDGKPGEKESRLLITAVYQKASIWNTYQEETYLLPERLKGIHDLYFELHQKIHLKGFVFRKYPKAFECLYANESEAIYGDQMRVTEKGVMDIGNNVTLEFSDMDFGSDGTDKICICGRTQNEKNTIHIRFFDGEKENRQIIEFPQEDEFTMQEFKIESVFGLQQVSFIFMPGSQFDFYSFQFLKKEG